MTASLGSLLADFLQSMTHAQLSDVPERVAGLRVPVGENLSKRDRIALALDAPESVLALAALRLATDRNDVVLDEAARKVLESDEPPLTEITRRDVARVLRNDLAGDRRTADVVERHFVLRDPLGQFFDTPGLSLRERVVRHMDENRGDWSVERLFAEIGAFGCSRFRFAALLQEAVHPLSRSGPEQARTVAALNGVLSRDGYELAQVGEISGHPLFAFGSVARGVVGRPKNLIFASSGPKPEIGFRDAINNDIVILSGEDSCLVYDRPIGVEGLKWAELVGWWGEANPGADANSLGKRLQRSLSSDAERNLFETYFRAFKPMLGGELPALIPQVYLHYDPAVVKTLRHRLPLARQRMDFLLLLPGRQRIVLEADGKHHFAEGDRPSLRAYAEMVSADRELRLAGYEVFRFGANELVGKDANATITGFLGKLFRSHRLLD